MSKTSWAIYKALDELTQCCEKHKETGNCRENCAMSVWCIEDYELSQIAYNVSHDTINDFVTEADELTTYCSKEDWDAEQANLKRCDPED